MLIYKYIAPFINATMAKQQCCRNQRRRSTGEETVTELGWATEAKGSAEKEAAKETLHSSST